MLLKQILLHKVKIFLLKRYEAPGERLSYFSGSECANGWLFVESGCNAVPILDYGFYETNGIYFCTCKLF